MLDYTRPIRSSDIDMSVYSRKFVMVDKFLAGQLDNRFFLAIWNDVTMFAYYFFKDNHGNRFKLYPYQDIILNDRHRFKYFRASNQIGKSQSFNIQAGRNLVIDHGYAHNEAIVSKSLPQSIDQMRRVKTLLNTANFEWKEDRGMTDSMSIITVDIVDKDGRFKYTNKLICAPCTEGLLGYDLHQLNLDEYEFWDIDLKYFFNQIAQPRTYTTKGGIFIMSNPNGSESHGSELENQRKKSGERKWHVYVFNYLDKPGNTREEYDDLKNELDRATFESTVDATRTLSDKYYFTADEVENSYDSELDRQKQWIATDKETFWFMDVGAKHDHSVLVGGFIEPDRDYPDKFIHLHIFCIHVYPKGYPLSRVVGSHDESHDTDGWHTEKSVKDYLEEYSLAKGVYPSFGCDTTGNEGMVALFDAIGIDAIEVKFSGPKKWGMYQRLKYFLEKRLLHRIKHDDFDYQMKRIVVSQLKTSRYHRVGHETEGDHDDVPDAVCGLISLVDNCELIEPSAEII